MPRDASQVSSGGPEAKGTKNLQVSDLNNAVNQNLLQHDIFLDSNFHSKKFSQNLRKENSFVVSVGIQVFSGMKLSPILKHLQIPEHFMHANLSSFTVGNKYYMSLRELVSIIQVTFGGVWHLR